MRVEGFRDDTLGQSGRISVQRTVAGTVKEAFEGLGERDIGLGIRTQGSKRSSDESGGQHCDQ